MLLSVNARTQLEQTGSTIFQTLAGLALDIKSSKHEKLAPAQGDPRDVQYLLNAFVVFNALEILAIVALSRLDRKQKEAASRRTSMLLPQTVDESEDEDAVPSAGKDGARGDDTWLTESDENDNGSRSRRGSQRGSQRGSRLSAHFARPSSSLPQEQSIPLLNGGSRPSTIRGSRYLVDAVVSETPSSPSVKAKVLRTKSEVRRGEIFAVLSGLLIASAWALFMGTAWMRLRSKSERGHGESGNSTMFL